MFVVGAEVGFIARLSRARIPFRAMGTTSAGAASSDNALAIAWSRSAVACWSRLFDLQAPVSGAGDGV